MKNIQANIEALDEAKKAVELHCLCASLKDNGEKYFVTLPLGYRVDAVQASQSGGKIVALERIFQALENIWNDKPPACPVIYSR